jgi:hypothetical protein
MVVIFGSGVRAEAPGVPEAGALAAADEAVPGAAPGAAGPVSAFLQAKGRRRAAIRAMRAARIMTIGGVRTNVAEGSGFP